MSYKGDNIMFFGSIPALITPFNNNKVDEKSFEKLINFQIDNGSSAVVPVGTTGESPTLIHDEHYKVIELCTQIVNKRVPVIVGAGSNNTEESIAYAQHAQKIGADAILCVTGYYNRPNKEGLKQHFLTLANNSSVPIIIYNIPARVIVDIDNDLMVELSNHKMIAGVKDATGQLDRTVHLAKHAAKDFCQLSGNDQTALAYYASGGHGCISVTANVAPRLCQNVFDFWQQKNIEQAIELNTKLIDLHNAMFCYPSPAPVKYAAKLMGLIESDEVRLPITQLHDEHKELIKKQMKMLELI